MGWDDEHEIYVVSFVIFLFEGIRNGNGDSILEVGRTLSQDSLGSTFDVQCEIAIRVFLVQL